MPCMKRHGGTLHANEKERSERSESEKATYILENVIFYCGDSKKIMVARGWQGE